MDNTSATGGFLALSPALGHTALEDFIHDLIAGVTGICGELVRPRLQPDPPRIPEADVLWCAFGLTDFTPANFPVLEHCSEGEGRSELIEQTEFIARLSFYGSGHMDAARRLRAGLFIAQNRAGLKEHGVAFVKTGPVIPVPEMAAAGWRARADLTLFFRQETRQTAAVLNFNEIDASVRTDSGPGVRPERNPAFSLGCGGCPRNCFISK